MIDLLLINRNPSGFIFIIRINNINNFMYYYFILKQVFYGNIIIEKFFKKIQTKYKNNLS